MKKKFEELVKLYIKLYPVEFEAMKNKSKSNRDLAWKDTGEIKGTDAIHRPICEVPAVLDEMILKTVNEEERKIYTSKEFSRWIAKNYEAFRPVKKV